MPEEIHDAHQFQERLVDKGEQWDFEAFKALRRIDRESQHDSSEVTAVVEGICRHLESEYEEAIIIDFIRTLFFQGIRNDEFGRMLYEKCADYFESIGKTELAEKLRRLY